MAKSKKKSEGETKEAVSVAPETTPEVVDIVEAPPAAIPPKQVMRVRFMQWFGTTGRPLHHMRGMQAFADTKGRKTIEQWNALFANY